MEWMELLIKNKLLFLVALFILVLAGCNNTTEDTNPYNFPEYVFNGKHPGTVAAYEYAVEAEDGILEYIPCYCNCSIEPFNHKNVKDCFISNTQSTDDLIVFDEHGAA